MASRPALEGALVQSTARKAHFVQPEGYVIWWFLAAIEADFLLGYGSVKFCLTHCSKATREQLELTVEAALETLLIHNGSWLALYISDSMEYRQFYQFAADITTMIRELHSEFVNLPSFGLLLKAGICKL